MMLLCTFLWGSQKSDAWYTFGLTTDQYAATLIGYEEFDIFLPHLNKPLQHTKLNIGQ